MEIRDWRWGRGGSGEVKEVDKTPGLGFNAKALMRA